MAAAATYDTQGLAAAKAYADAVGGTFAAFKDGLLFFDALKSGDFALDTTALARFEADAAQAIAVAGRLETLAQASGSTALSGVMGGLNTAAQTLTTLADVPAAPVLAAQGGRGGGNSFTANFYITAADGIDTNALADATVRKLNSWVSSYA